MRADLRLALAAAAGVAVLALVVGAGVWWVLPAKPAVAREGCLTCHGGVRGIEASHDPDRIGCAACHLGDARARDAATAHAGLERIPGNLGNAGKTCGSATCHPQMVARVDASIMTTMVGVVAVDRWVFGEQAAPSGDTPVAAIGHSPADSHLRNLCASCHLGAPKTVYGPLDETSRGGGCLACHLAYSDEAVRSLQNLQLDRSTAFHGVHPRVTADVDDARCFGCHARSGRISLNYRGWRESSGESLPAGTPSRTLADGRVVHRATADVHAEAGLSCVDCHGSWDVMGDGTRTRHAGDAGLVRCDDCHRATLRSVGADELDPDARQLVALRGGAEPGRRWLATSRGHSLVNTRVSGDTAVLVPKGTTRERPIHVPAKSCTAPSHAAITCAGCHDAWAPTCLGCHTEFDPKGTMFDLLADAEAPGEWTEHGGATLADPASLGVRDRDGRRTIREFVPGMVLTLARDVSEREKPLLRRLFAPVTPHTIRREARSCAGCHLDPVALGYGRGALVLQGRRWTFTPSRPRLSDGLADDAWIGFLEARGADSTTREDTRPFTIAEQRRILTVGACLGCHAPGSKPMVDGLEAFAPVLARRTTKCVVPEW